MYKLHPPSKCPSIASILKFYVSTLTIILKIRSLNCVSACPFTKETEKFHKIQIMSTNCAHIIV